MAPIKKRQTPLVPKRKARILDFKLQSLSSPDQLGVLGSKKWRRNLLEHMEDPDVTPADIERWIKSHGWILEILTPAPPLQEVDTPRRRTRREESPVAESLTPSPNHSDSDFAESNITDIVYNATSTNSPNRHTGIRQPKNISKKRSNPRAKGGHNRRQGKSSSSRHGSSGTRKGTLPDRRSCSNDSAALAIIDLKRNLDNITEDFLDDTDAEEMARHGPGARGHLSRTAVNIWNSNHTRPLRPTTIHPGYGALRTQAMGGGAGFRAGRAGRRGRSFPGPIPMSYAYHFGSGDSISTNLKDPGPGDVASKKAFLLQTIFGHSYSIGCFLNELPDAAGMAKPLDTFVKSILVYHERYLRRTQ